MVENTPYRRDETGQRMFKDRSRFAHRKLGKAARGSGETPEMFCRGPDSPPAERMFSSYKRTP